MKKVFCGAGLCLAVLATGCHRQAQSPVPPPTAPPAAPGKAVVYVVNPKATGAQDPLTPRTVKVRHPDMPARDAVDALLHAPGSPLPAGTALRGMTVANGLATLDFSQNPVDETGGEGHQSDALNALAKTLGQFPDIRQYQIEVKGQVVKTFGEFTTDGPMDVVRPEAASAQGAP